MKLPAEEPSSTASPASQSGCGGTTKIFPGSEDAGICGALDAICTGSEQTYQDMMQSFTYLTHGDVVRSPALTDQDQIPSSTCTDLSSLSVSETGSIDELVPSVDGSTTWHPALDGDDLEEQVLSEGTKTSDILLRRVDVGFHAHIKVDNFIASESDEEETASEYSGYQPSFADTDEVSLISQHARDARDPTLLPCKASPLVTNDMAHDVRKDMDSVDDTASKCWTRFFSRQHDTARLDKDGEQKEVWDMLGEEEEEGEVETGSLPQILERELVTPATKTVALEVACSDNSQNVAPSKQGSREEDVENGVPDAIDIEVENLATEIRYSAQDFGDSEHEECSTLISAAGEVQPSVLNKVNPGEAEDVGDMCKEEEITHVRKLPFSSRAQSGKDLSDQENISCVNVTNETTGDTVEPFHLDEDFDYDNVCLTPKYSQEEMAILMAAMLQSNQAVSNQ